MNQMKKEIGITYVKYMANMKIHMFIEKLLMDMEFIILNTLNIKIYGKNYQLQRIFLACMYTILLLEEQMNTLTKLIRAK